MEEPKRVETYAELLARVEQWKVDQGHQPGDQYHVCNICMASKHESEFGKNAKNPNGLMYACKFCSNYRYHDLLTEANFNAMVEAQEGKCALCEEPAERLFVDHDQSCCPSGRSCVKCRRGLVCSQCRSGLGSFKTQTRLEQAMAYIKRYK